MTAPRILAQLRETEHAAAALAEAQPSFRIPARKIAAAGDLVENWLRTETPAVVADATPPPTGATAKVATTAPPAAEKAAEKGSRR